MNPYPEQIEAAKKAAQVGRGTICMPTGCGKSVAMALLVNELKVKTLIVVPNLELKKQLTSSFKAWFGSLEHIRIENIDSGGLDSDEKYDCLIIDEAHHVAAKTYRRLNKKRWGGIFYRFFFTATPFRSRDEEQLLMESVAGQVIYRIDYATAVAKGYIVPVEAYYVSLPKVTVKGYRWAEVYSELVVNRKDRNQIIAAMLHDLLQTNTPTLCLVKEIKHGEAIQQLTPGKPGFAKGENENNRELILEYCLGERKCLIGTTGVLGEGVDTKPAEFVIIAGLGKSRNSLMQAVGRAVRRCGDKQSAKVIIFKDPSHKFTIRHFNAQCKILREEYGVIPVSII